jgi:MFS family permease
VLNVSTVNFALWHIGCALSPNLTALIVFRLLTGIGGSGCLAIGSGVIADLFEKEQRGLASTIYSIGPLFGPVLGPICGGFVAELAGWRWVRCQHLWNASILIIAQVFWVLLIAAGTITTGILIFNRETNPKVLMKRKTQRLRRELNRDDLRSCYEVSHKGQPLSFKHILLHGLIRPVKMFIFLPIVAMLSTYMAFVYGLLYLLFTTITKVFEVTYGWPADLCGFAYTGIGIGLLAGVILMANVSDSSIEKLTKANGGVYEPEMRLKLCLPFACLIPIS